MKKVTQEKAWYALYTRPKAEFKAAEQLNSIGVKNYLPAITKIRQWSDRKKKITEPLLKGYIFIYATEKERGNSLEENSIIRCVFDHGRPARIPEWQIDNLRKMLSQDADFFINDGLVPGAKVKIKDGPFEGIIGVILENENEKNLAVSIDLLNRTIIAHLPKESLFEVVKDINA